MAAEQDDVDAMVEPVVPSRHRWLAGLLGAGPGDLVADLGCGTGGTLAQVMPVLAGGGAVGVDASRAALARTAEALATERARLLLVQADLKDRLPFADAAFDRVVCHNVLECLPDPDALVVEAARVLRPGGRLVLGHSDFDTLVFASEDLELTRRLVRASLAADDGAVRLRIRDDGVGFDPLVARRLAGERHFGLAGMRERVEMVGGRLVVDSAPGRGPRQGRDGPRAVPV
jgi:SAM-dependent methyltransferase